MQTSFAVSKLPKQSRGTVKRQVPEFTVHTRSVLHAEHGRVTLRDMVTLSGSRRRQVAVLTARPHHPPPRIAVRTAPDCGHVSRLCHTATLARRPPPLPITADHIEKESLGEDTMPTNDTGRAHTHTHTYKAHLIIHFITSVKN
jgi:hypothetical protein